MAGLAYFGGNDIDIDGKQAALLDGVHHLGPNAARNRWFARLTAGGEWIRTFSTAARNPRISGQASTKCDPVEADLILN
jgi:hypothetical protein